MGRDLHRGVHARRRGAADQERLLHREPLHLVRDVRHFLERRRDEAGQPDEVGVALDRGVEDLLRGHHDAEVDHLEVVALEHDADDVLADVVHVALHRRHHDRALGLARVARQRLLLLDERHEMAHRLLHHARGLHDLRQEHLAGAEEVADDVHAGHQRPFDHLDGPRVLLPRLLGVLDDVRRDALDQRVRQALLDARLAPREVLGRDLALRLHRFGERHEPLGGVRRGG